MKMKKAALTLCCVLALGAAPAYALRCGTSLVAEGDRKAEVLRKCGDPITVEQWVEERVIGDPNQPGFDPRFKRAVYQTVYVEEWTYNFGPQQFMRLLRFENGKLRSIRELERGY